MKDLKVKFVNLIERNQFLRGIFYGLLGGVIGLFILFLISKNTTLYGNVADWASGLGSIGAIVLVYRQIKESQKQSAEQIEVSKNQLDKQIEVSKKQLDKQISTSQLQLKEQLEASTERDFRIERPLFKIVRFFDIDVSKIRRSLCTNILYTVRDPISVWNNIKSGKKYEFFTLKNISQKIMCGVKIELIYNNEKYPKSIFYVDYIDGYSAINIFDDLQFVDENEFFTEKSDGLKEVVVSFNTGVRELLVLQFLAGEDGALVYNKEGAYIENKHKNIQDAPDYNLDNFKESYSYKEPGA